MSPYTTISQITEELKYMRTIQSEPVQLLRDRFAPPATSHDFTLKMKFEEEFVY